SRGHFARRVTRPGAFVARIRLAQPIRRNAAGRCATKPGCLPCHSWKLEVLAGDVREACASWTVLVRPPQALRVWCWSIAAWTAARDWRPAVAYFSFASA